MFWGVNQRFYERYKFRVASVPKVRLTSKVNNFPRKPQRTSGWPELPEIITPSHLKFLGEHIDPADDKLKNFYRHIYAQTNFLRIVRRAYLARISYGDPPMETVVHCERHSEKIEEVLLLGPFKHMFGEIRRRGDSYDQMLICEEQEQELRRVCRPFYEAA